MIIHRLMHALEVMMGTIFVCMLIDWKENKNVPPADQQIFMSPKLIEVFHEIDEAADVMDVEVDTAIDTVIGNHQVSSV